ncbi:MAG: hypothetical protein ACKPKO_30995, partial [Candidatus Fonsibacter sp.]
FTSSSKIKHQRASNICYEQISRYGMFLAVDETVAHKYNVFVKQMFYNADTTTPTASTRQGRRKRQ